VFKVTPVYGTLNNFKNLSHEKIIKKCSLSSSHIYGRNHCERNGD